MDDKYLLYIINEIRNIVENTDDFFDGVCNYIYRWANINTLLVNYKDYNLELEKLKQKNYIVCSKELEIKSDKYYLVLYRKAVENTEMKFSQIELIVIELFYTFIIIKNKNDKSNFENLCNQKKESVKSALQILSYSELEGVLEIFSQLNVGESEIFFVSSNIAQKIGVARTAIVNAIKKLESASIIESRSLGMKGTYIKILNEQLIEEIKNYL